MGLLPVGFRGGLRVLAAASCLLLAVAPAHRASARQTPSGTDDGAAASAAPIASAAAADTAPGPVFHARVDSIIQPVVAEFLRDTLAEADAAGAEALVVELSTPGGLLTSTREIFTAMLGAATPVVMYVSPSGAQAASAGFFLLMAADVAAMAPGTNTGAAHPVGGQGEDIEGTMGEKVEQDSAATVRSLAARHGRNAELAQAAVVESRSFTADEALEAGLIDRVEPDLAALLAALDGTRVEKAGRTVTLATAAAEVREVEMSPWRKVLATLAHPNLTYILLSLGLLGLYFELMHPGAILPGVVGGIFLILAFFGLSVLPVDYAGVALIGLAIILFIAEIKVTSYGMLTVGGVISLALGGLMLFKSPVPALRVSLELVVGMAVFALVVVGFLLSLALRAQRSRVRTGEEGLVGEAGRAVTELAAGPGKVFVHGEVWNARSSRPVALGDAVRVTAVHGMLLDVEPVTDAAALAEGVARMGGASGVGT